MSLFQLCIVSHWYILDPHQVSWHAVGIRQESPVSTKRCSRSTVLQLSAVSTMSLFSWLSRLICFFAHLYRWWSNLSWSKILTVKIWFVFNFSIKFKYQKLPKLKTIPKFSVFTVYVYVVQTKTALQWPVCTCETVNCEQTATYWAWKCPWINGAITQNDKVETGRSDLFPDMMGYSYSS